MINIEKSEEFVVLVKSLVEMKANVKRFQIQIILKTVLFCVNTSVEVFTVFF